MTPAQKPAQQQQGLMRGVHAPPAADIEALLRAQPMHYYSPGITTLGAVHGAMSFNSTSLGLSQ